MNETIKLRTKEDMLKALEMVKKETNSNSNASRIATVLENVILKYGYNREEFQEFLKKNLIDDAYENIFEFICFLEDEIQPEDIWVI